MQSDEKSLLFQCLLSEKELDAKGIPTSYSSIKNIKSATDCTNKKLAMCDGKKIKVENYTHNTITYIKGESGRATGEKNKLRAYAKLCDGYIIKKPIFYQCEIPWPLNGLCPNSELEITTCSLKRVVISGLKFH